MQFIFINYVIAKYHLELNRLEQIMATNSKLVYIKNPSQNLKRNRS